MRKYQDEARQRTVSLKFEMSAIRHAPAPPNFATAVHTFQASITQIIFLRHRF